MTNDLLKVVNEEVLIFLSFLVLSAYEANINKKYTILSSEYKYIRNFAKSFAINGLFYNVMILELGVTNITNSWFDVKKFITNAVIP